MIENSRRTLAVDESGFVPIGNIAQWVTIRGKNIENPALLFLHGGPAQAQSLFLREVALWESDFTVINWDQRGSGRTYGKNGASTPEMTIERMAQDAIEVSEHVRRRLAKQKLFLVGHSWGSVLGLIVLKQRPDLFSVYVGTGQVVNWERTLQDRVRWARRQIAKVRDSAALQQLDEADAFPITDTKRLEATASWVMPPADTAYIKTHDDFLRSPPSSSKACVADFTAGLAFSRPALFPTVTSFDARKVSLVFPVPFFVIQGRDDHMVSFGDAEAYIEDVHAPIKAFVPIDGGHYACFTHSDQFVSALRKHARPSLSSQAR
jgi:pimeloyl-ACP methyl ester carboxylesterase